MNTAIKNLLFGIVVYLSGISMGWYIHDSYGADNDYCTVTETWLNVTYIEYCIFNGVPLPCDTEQEQLRCVEINKLLESEK